MENPTEEEMIKRLAARMIGQTVGFEDQFATDQALYEFGYTADSMDRGDPIHFGAVVDVELLRDEEGDLYYQVTFIEAGEDVG